MRPSGEQARPSSTDEQTRVAAAWYGDPASAGGGGHRADWQGAPDPVGETLGDRYLVEQEIGSGAFSITYRGRDDRLGRTVAIKVLRPTYALDPTYVQRFEREARTAASISQGNVVDVYDFGRHGELLYIVMQYVEGEDLKHLIVREGPLPPRRAVEISRQVLAGLAAIHHAGIIHRDIKPQNVLIGNDGIARVTDFGVAHVTIDAGLTTAGTTVGTASYMAPEQAQAEALTEATDLYAVGVVLYEMLTGRLPFEAPTAIALMLAHIRDQPVPPSHRAPDRPIPASLDAVVMRALAKPPEDRYRDSAAMARALSSSLQDSAAVTAVTQALPVERPRAAQPASRPAQPAQPASRRLGVVPIGLLVLVLIGGALAGATLIFADGDDPNTNLPAGARSTETPTVAVTATATVDATATASAEAAILATEEAERQGSVPTETPEQVPTETPTEAVPTVTPPPTETIAPTDTPEPTETPEPTVAATLEPTATEPSLDEETSAPIVPIDSTEVPPDEAEEGTEGGVEGNQLVEDQSRSNEQAAESGQTYTGEIGAEDWNGAYYRDVGNLQPWAGLYSQATDYSTGTIAFDLPEEPSGETFTLTVEGMTSENFSEIPLAIEVNGVEVDRFNTPFPSWNGVEGDQPWTEETFTLPTSSLQAGRNEITIVNLIETGEFGLPPYVLLADASISIEVAQASGSTNADQSATSSVADSQSDSDLAVENATEEVAEENPGNGQGNQLIERTGQSDAQGAGPSRTYTGEVGAGDWNGAYYRDVGNLQPWAGLYSQATDYSTGAIVFTLPGEPTEETFDFTVEGMTSENFTQVPLAIEINGVEVDRFNTPFPSWNGTEGDQPWTVVTFTLPTGPLQVGRNQITILNLLEDGEFGLPPYVLLADASFSIEVASGSGTGANSNLVARSSNADSQSASNQVIQRAPEVDDGGQGQGRGRGRRGGDDNDEGEGGGDG